MTTMSTNKAETSLEITFYILRALPRRTLNLHKGFHVKAECNVAVDVSSELCCPAVDASLAFIHLRRFD